MNPKSLPMNITQRFRLKKKNILWEPRVGSCSTALNFDYLSQWGWEPDQKGGTAKNTPKGVA